MSKNTNLHSAKKNKNDEFYTQLTDIEKELVHYVDFFEGKTVYCNCDDARESNFFKYFSNRFEELGLKKLISTGYNENGHGVVCIYEGDKNGNRVVDDEEVKVVDLKGNGDFRSEECIKFLKEADVVVTNPPFSLFREYVAQLMKYEKKFLILSNNNAITFKEFFPYIKNNKVWLGRTLFTGKMPFFRVPDDYPLENQRFERRGDGLYKQVNSICWFTNIQNDNKRDVLVIYKKYYGHENEYPKYDNYDAIECERIANLPIDLPIGSVVGVPITSLKYLWSDGFLYFDDGNENTQIYEIEKFRKGDDNKDLNYKRERELRRTSEYLSDVPNNSIRQICQWEQISEQEDVYKWKRNICENNHQAYEIIGMMSGAKGVDLTNGNDGRLKFYINNKGVYARILIRKKQ